MKRLLMLLNLVMLLLVTWSVAQSGRTLEAKLTYSGSETVDEAHQLYVFVFDSPNIGQPGLMPIAYGQVSSNGEVVRLTGLTTSPVYLAVAMDSGGTYTPGFGPPPSGSPASIYGDGGVAKAVEIDEGGTAEVEIVFDDTFRMP